MLNTNILAIKIFFEIFIFLDQIFNLNFENKTMDDDKITVLEIPNFGTKDSERQSLVSLKSQKDPRIIFCVNNGSKLNDSDFLCNPVIYENK